MSPHGTRARYFNGPCRCPECRRANAEYVRRQGWSSKGVRRTVGDPAADAPRRFRDLRDLMAAG